MKFTKADYSLALVAVIFLMIGGGTLAKMVDVPQVFYSVETRKPVYLEVEGKKRMVSPSTKIPTRHEVVWVP